MTYGAHVKYGDTEGGKRSSWGSKITGNNQLYQLKSMGVPFVQDKNKSYKERFSSLYSNKNVIERKCKDY